MKPARLVLLVGVVAGACLATAPGRADDAAGLPAFRVAFTSAMFSEVNENDARASVKAWATSVARERNLNVRAEPLIFTSLDATAEAFRQSSVDAAGVSTAEYFDLEPQVRWGTLFAATTGDEITESYVLLVHRDGGFARLQDLRGRHVLLYKAPRTGLAGHWLGGLLADARLPPPAKFFGRLSSVMKLSQAVLPVFFRQAEACIVTRGGFETLAELNPQIGKEVVALATSPAIVTAVFCFRADFDSPARNGLIEGVRGLHLTASGRQVLTVFQSGRLVEISPAALAGARQIYDSDRAPVRSRAPLGAGDGPVAPRAPGRRTP